MRLFDTFNKDTLDNQFVLLTRYAYTAIDNPRNAKIRNAIYKTIVKNGTLTGLKSDDLPSSLDDIYKLYLEQPISDKDEYMYLATFNIPFMSTGLTIKELKTINPDAINDTLQLLMKSKKIQYILDNARNICRDLRIMRICTNSSQLKLDIESQLSKYTDAYEDVENQIHINWINAIGKEPRFHAKEGLFVKSAFGKEGSKFGGRNRRLSRRLSRHNFKRSKTKKR